MQERYIYHITSFYDWELQKNTGKYVHKSLGDEGFIHCSTKNQVSKVLERYYKDQSGLVLIKVDSQKLRSELKYEEAPTDGDHYPHVFGPIHVEAVVGSELL